MKLESNTLGDYSIDIVALEKDFAHVDNVWNSKLNFAIDKLATDTFNNAFNTDREERIFTNDAS